jgi:hypothetical protein
MAVKLKPYPVSDSPIDQDLLGYEPYAHAMAQLISSPNLETPFTVGIFGPWGTGKTTFMYLLNRNVKNACTVFFQPWQFEKKEEVWKALIYTVLQRLEELDRNQRSEAERQNVRLMKLFKGVGKLALSSTISALTQNRADIDTLISFYSESERDNAKFINTFRKEFEDLKNEILGTAKGESARLTVFVDDLDRCTPENCIMVLEAIKLFFDFKGCVFVIGIDREVVQKGIEIKYDDRLKVRGVDYLEKMIQLPFTLPPVPKDTFRNFVKIITDPFGFDQVSKELITQASEENPRRVKRLCNCLFMVSHVAQELIKNSKTSRSLAKKGIDEGKLALLLILQVRFPLAYGWLTSHPYTFEKLSKEWNTRRSELVALMTDSYGKNLSEQVANEFFTFLQTAYHDETIGVKDFDSSEELGDYLRITGVVETSERPLGKPTRNVLDDKLGILEAPESEMDKTSGDERKRLDAGSSEEIQFIEAKAIDIVKEWQTLQNAGLLTLWRKNPRPLADQLRDLIHTAGRIISVLRRATPREHITRWRIEELLSQLDKINNVRAFHLLRSTGRSLMFSCLAASVPIVFLVGYFYTRLVYAGEIPFITSLDVIFVSGLLHPLVWVLEILLLAVAVRGWQFILLGKRIKLEHF